MPPREAASVGAVSFQAALRVLLDSIYMSGTSTATTVASIIIDDAAPTPSWPRLNENVYMKIAGSEDEVPGPPAVSAMTRSNVLIARCQRISSTEKNTGRMLGITILR